MKNSKLILTAVLNALGVAVYVFLVSLIMINGDRIFGAMVDGPIAPVAFLLLFVFSALVTGGLILAKPIMLYLDGQKKEGVKLLLCTGVGLLILLLLAFLGLVLIK